MSLGDETGYMQDLNVWPEFLSFWMCRKSQLSVCAVLFFEWSLVRISFELRQLPGRSSPRKEHIDINLPCFCGNDSEKFCSHFWFQYWDIFWKSWACTHTRFEPCPTQCLHGFGWPIANLPALQRYKFGGYRISFECLSWRSGPQDTEIHPALNSVPLILPKEKRVVERGTANKSSFLLFSEQNLPFLPRTYLSKLFRLSVSLCFWRQTEYAKIPRSMRNRIFTVSH